MQQAKLGQAPVFATLGRVLGDLPRHVRELRRDRLVQQRADLHRPAAVAGQHARRLAAGLQQQLAAQRRGHGHVVDRLPRQRHIVSPTAGRVSIPRWPH
jgi:hypothetical protein